MELKSKTTTYTMSQDDILNLISEKLEVDKSRITVQYVLKTVGDSDRYGYSSWQEFDYMNITVDNKGT